MWHLLSTINTDRLGAKIEGKLLGLEVKYRFAQHWWYSYVLRDLTKLFHFSQIHLFQAIDPAAAANWKSVNWNVSYLCSQKQRILVWIAGSWEMWWPEALYYLCVCHCCPVSAALFPIELIAGHVSWFVSGLVIGSCAGAPVHIVSYCCRG